ncbi:hypothetical protein CC86DRAFT_449427 [Ophiobolus disseminans]|uniref:Uncharacterized protein n=1 Tax=Ophiobolus disseminans TaxID=1469910 RepID=A0A6A6ZGY8_9PLEO|nr:hypothetical protein CC86DRAFT_449427 [Ophiobolus disseminans]
MSTITTSVRRAESTTPTTLRRESATPTTSEEDAPESTTVQRQFSLIQLDFATPTPSATADTTNSISNAASHSLLPSASCSSNSDCASDRTCSKGICASLVDAAPFGPAGSSSTQSTTKMSTAAAIGVGAGVVGFILLLFGLGVWFWRRRGRRPLDPSSEAPPTTRTRSASTATDQKTLVASVPNSPHNANFSAQHDQMAPAFFAKLAEANNPLGQTRSGTERRQESLVALNRQRSASTRKNLPLPPSDMPLPPPPTEEKRYAINVNINKSMIFEDANFTTASTPRDSGVSRDRMPRYRFEEYLPPVTRTPPLSIDQTKFKKRTSDYEMAPYPRKDSVSDTGVSIDEEEDDETQLRRNRTLKKLESEPPQLPLPDLPPPSPSFSFASYDWYQDIIGTDQGNLDDPISRTPTPTPTLPERNPARTPTQATFGAALFSNPPDIKPLTLPRPLSPMVPPSPVPSAILLHPSTAALSTPATLPSPTTPTFRLSPTVYTMPSQPPKARPTRASLQSTMTSKTHMSRSWLPDDGLYLPEEGTHDSYMMFRRRLSDASRPTSYSPL